MVKDKNFELIFNQLNAELVDLYNQAKYGEVIAKGQTVLQWADSVIGANDPVIGATLNNIAEAHRALGEYDEAESLYRRDLAITALFRDQVAA